MFEKTASAIERNHPKACRRQNRPLQCCAGSAETYATTRPFREDRGSISRPLEHDGLKLYRFAAARSIDGAVSQTGWIAERDPELRKQPHAK
jgi:hypothetical protein